MTSTVPRLQQREVIAVLLAARRARAAYAGPVGEFLTRELAGYIQAGRRASPTALVGRLLADLERLPPGGIGGGHLGTAAAQQALDSDDEQFDDDGMLLGELPLFTSAPAVAREGSAR